jgi:signal transduction histidine kinase
MADSRPEIGAFVSQVDLERRISLVRWVGIAASTVVGNFLTRQPVSYPLFNLSLLAAVLANLTMYFAVNRYLDRAIPRASYIIAFVDVSLITVGCLFSGGIYSDLRYLYLVAVVVSAFRFDVKVTVTISVASAMAYAALAFQTTGDGTVTSLLADMGIFMTFMLVLATAGVLLTVLLVAAGHRIATTAARNAELVEELKGALEELRRAQEQIIQAEKEAAVVELAGATAHELYQPLTVAWGFAEFLLKDMTEDDSLYRPLERIIKNLASMQDIVERIGKITRYETQDYPGGIQIVDIDRSAAPEPCSPDEPMNEKDTA